MTQHNYTLIGGKTCNGIDDETRGIQLSYINDDSNGWIQIAYFSDTQLYSVSIVSDIVHCILRLLQNSSEIVEMLPAAARRPNTRLRWRQPNHSSMLLRDVWSIDEIVIFERPLHYNLQFRYTTSCSSNTPTE